MLAFPKPKKPKSPKSAFTAVALFVKEGKVLMLSKPKMKHGISLERWAFPGGTFENNESPIEAATREGEEETGLVGKNGELLGFKRKENGRYVFYVLFTEFTGEPATNAEPHKHKRIAWMGAPEKRYLYIKELAPHIEEALNKNVVFKPR